MKGFETSDSVLNAYKNSSGKDPLEDREEKRGGGKGTVSQLIIVTIKLPY